jgi:probable phosphoglycerate mutase
VTTFYLVRHALCDAVGTSLAGRAPGMPLNAEGRAQAARLADRFRELPLDAVYTSPVERARETASAIAAVRALTPVVLDALIEFDVGDWTGASIASLAGDPVWTRFNSFRSGTSAPGGELAAQMQARVVAALIELRDSAPTAAIAVVSHSDVLRAALAYFLGVPIDLAHRIEIEPASVTVLALDEWGPRLLSLNAR